MEDVLEVYRRPYDPKRPQVEIDGGQHYEKDGAIRDGLRDGHLESLGLYVLRFSNLDVLGNIDGVLAAIVEHLETVFDQLKTNS